MVKELMKCFVLVLAFITSSQILTAETLVCKFANYHTPDKNRLQIDTEFGMVFRYDPITREAFMEGNAGISSVVLTDGYDGLTFLEFIPSGAVQSTTVARNGVAVHSRHSLMFGDLIPTQYYGRCE